jgi:hypothetical protein
VTVPFNAPNSVAWLKSLYGHSVMQARNTIRANIIPLRSVMALKVIFFTGRPPGNHAKQPHAKRRQALGRQSKSRLAIKSVEAL